MAWSINMLSPYGQRGPAASSVPVRMTVSLSVAADKRMPEVTRGDVIVRQGKNRLTVIDNQYLLRFEAVPGKNAGLQNIDPSTELAGVDLSSANGVWVPNPQ